MSLIGVPVNETRRNRSSVNRKNEIYLLRSHKVSNLLIAVLIFVESALLTPEVFESPELKRVRFTTEMPSVVLDSDNDRKCFALLLC